MAHSKNEMEFRQRLAEYMEAVLDTPLSIDDLQAAAGGVSQDTWRFTAKIEGGPPQSFILRRDLATTISDQTLSRKQEFLVMQAVQAAGILAPRPRWYCIEPALLGAPFFIMDYLDGSAIGSQVVTNPELADARAALPGQLAEQLARIHAVPFDAPGLAFLSRPRPGFSPAQEAIAQTRTLILKLKINNPALEFGLRWAEKHAPASGGLALLHGDYRIGNFLVTPRGLNGVIDWEFSHIGDPAEDLAWPCLRGWRYGNGRLHFGGIAPREVFLTAYERASGRAVNRGQVAYWEILGNLRWAVACLAQANRHLSGGDVSVELASLGRRSAEMQYEMLRLIANQEG